MSSVYVGMSGGVDSSVAAYLLKQQGYDVTGFTFELWDKTDKTDIKDAKAVCEKLNIPHVTVDLKDKFKDTVLKNFYDEYKAGRTPNPCVVCNKYIKFGAMLDYIKDKADYTATGHYANVNFRGGRYYFSQADDVKKDQTYMLYTLSQEQISKILMPLGKYSKPEIRQIAENLGLVTAHKSDSQDICFLEGTGLADFIKNNNPSLLKKGEIIDENGKLLGYHDGICHYTIGQRRGLKISSDKKIYVTKIDAENNRVVLDEEKYIFSDTLVAENVNFQPMEFPTEDICVKAKIRYASRPADAIVTPLENGCVQVKFKEPQRAITKGQSVVFYDGNVLVGGGIIKNEGVSL